MSKIIVPFTVFLIVILANYHKDIRQPLFTLLRLGLVKLKQLPGAIANLAAGVLLVNTAHTYIELLRSQN